MSDIEPWMGIAAAVLALLIAAFGGAVVMPRGKAQAPKPPDAERAPAVQAAEAGVEKASKRHATASFQIDEAVAKAREATGPQDPATPPEATGMADLMNRRRKP